MKKHPFLSHLAFALFAVMLIPVVVNALSVEVEIGATKDQASAVTKSTKNLVAIADPLDTKFLFSGEPASSLRFYKEGDETFSIITGVGDDTVEMPAYFFTPGNYIVVDTNESTGCATLILDECRAQSGFISEAPILVP